MQTIQPFWQKDWQLNRRPAIIGAAAIAFIIFLTTLQLHINGSNHPYATDVGEIQNALPRWGTIHYNGYPLYTFIGSVFVSSLRGLGIQPAAGASLYSAAWGAVSVGLLVQLLVGLGIRPLPAALTALLFALATSIWVDASIAEVHTMSMALTFKTLFYAVKFGRNGNKSALYWLAFWGGMTLAHQRAFALFIPAILFWAYPHWRKIINQFLSLVALGMIGPLTYLYLPIRAWMGADWTYSSPGTWQGFWALVFYSRSDLVIIPNSAELWLERIRGLGVLLSNDWPWMLMILGMLGLLIPGTPTRWQERWGFFASWLLHLLVSFIIWEGRVSDALLAMKLPIIAITAVGIAILLEYVWRKQPAWGKLVFIGGCAVAIWLFLNNRADVLAITRDRSAFKTIALAERIPPAEDGRSQTLMALWGHDYWALTYAQAFENKFPDLTLIDHDQDFKAVVENNHLLTLSKTFYERPPQWWATMIGDVYLTAIAPEIIKIQPKPTITPIQPEQALFDLGNGIIIREINLTQEDADKIILSVSWQAVQANLADYSIGVHLAAQDPPLTPGDILAQADRSHPVNGWYPTSQWQPGEVVTDFFILPIPPATIPKAIRVGMYQILADGSFQNTAWLTIPMP